MSDRRLLDRHRYEHPELVRGGLQRSEPMSQFIYLYRVAEDARRQAMGTPERAQQSMQRWLAWMKELDAQGHLKERGQPLEMTGKVVRGQEKSVTDGPYTEA